MEPAGILYNCSNSAVTIVAKESINPGEGEHPVGKRELVSKWKPNLYLTSVCPFALTMLLSERGFSRKKTSLLEWTDRSEVQYLEGWLLCQVLFNRLPVTCRMRVNSEISQVVDGTP